MALSKLDSTALGTLSGDIVFASGQGIDFSATSDGSGTTSSELFDDYEEGSFSITVAGGVTSPAYTNAYGHYTKVGRLVYFAINLDLSSGTANGSHFILSGLPFTSANIASYGGAFANYNAGFKTDGNVTVHVPQNSTQIHFYERDGSTLTGTEVSNVLANFIINGFYITA